MRTAFLPFSKPSISTADIQAVTDVLQSGWITTGPKAAAFEDRFCEVIGCAGAVALSSATAGMHLALKSLGMEKGDEVVTPSMTWVSTVNLIVLSGATPVFADIDKDTLMVTKDSLTACITDRTRLIIPVHFAGASADVAAIRGISQKHGIPVIEDAAHALGSMYDSENIGQKGTSIFSFHPIKNITTGEGGMFCSDDPSLLESVRRLKFHGLGKDAFDRKTQGRSPQAEVMEPGFKYNMTDMAAALGISQIERLRELNDKRRSLAEIYKKELSLIDEVIPLAEPVYPIRHAWHLFIVRLDTEKAGMTRDAFMEALKERNIGTGLHFRAVHLQRYYRETMPAYTGALPNTEWNSKRICSLPLFPDMSKNDVYDVIEAIKGVLKR